MQLPNSIHLHEQFMAHNMVTACAWPNDETTSWHRYLAVVGPSAGLIILHVDV